MPAAAFRNLLAAALLLVASAATLRAEEGEQRHFFWKVSGDKGVVFLLGTVHAATADLYPLPPIIEVCFKQSEVLVEEIDLSRAEEAADAQRYMQQKGVYPASDSVANHLREGTTARLVQYAKGGRLGDDYTRLKPWLLTLLIEQDEIKALGLDKDQGIDEHFLAEAQQQHKPIMALESANAQMQMFSSFPDKLQDEILLATLLDSSTSKETLDQIFAAWKAGDDAAMETVITQTIRDHPAAAPAMDKLFYERNTAMTQQIDQYLKTPKVYFVAVGAGHLVGERGIISLLRQKNYKIEQAVDK